MVLQRGSHDIVQTMLSDTILALCRNTLQYQGHFNIEALIGITLDDKEIFLININEKIQKDGAVSTPSKRKAVENKDNSEDSSSGESDSDSQGTPKKKRKRKKKRRSVERDSGSAPLEMSVERDYSRVSDNANTGDADDDSRLSANVKKEYYSDNDNSGDGDIVFVKEEPKEFASDSSCSYSQGNFAVPGSGPPHGDLSQSDISGFGQLQELALQLSGDMSSSSMGTPGRMGSQNVSGTGPLPPTPGGSSDQGGRAVRPPLHPPDRLRTPGSNEDSIIDECKVYVSDKDGQQLVYRCKFCGQITAFRGNMRKHLRTHTRAKPFVCTICNYASSQSTNLKRHMLRHSSEK